MKQASSYSSPRVETELPVTIVLHPPTPLPLLIYRFKIPSCCLWSDRWWSHTTLASDLCDRSPLHLILLRSYLDSIRIYWLSSRFGPSDSAENGGLRSDDSWSGTLNFCDSGSLFGFLFLLGGILIDALNILWECC